MYTNEVWIIGGKNHRRVIAVPSAVVFVVVVVIVIDVVVFVVVVVIAVAVVGVIIVGSSGGKVKMCFSWKRRPPFASVQLLFQRVMCRTINNQTKT